MEQQDSLAPFISDENLTVFYLNGTRKDAEFLNFDRALCQATACLRERDSFLTAMMLCDISLSLEVQSALASCLRENSTLTILYLKRVDIAQQKTVELARSLAVNTTLTYLDLTWDSISYTGAVPIAEALKINSTLTSLELGCAYVGDKEIESFSSMLEQNRTLVRLDLNDTQLSIIGAMRLSTALTINDTLTHLYMHDALAKIDDCKTMAMHMQENTALTFLYIGYACTYSNPFAKMTHRNKNDQRRRLVTLARIIFILARERSKRSHATQRNVLPFLPLDLLIYMVSFFRSADFGMSKQVLLTWIRPILVGTHRIERISANDLGIDYVVLTPVVTTTMTEQLSFLSFFLAP